jgi:hypothetical protein
MTTAYATGPDGLRWTWRGTAARAPARARGTPAARG